jgi:hypothetical protein
VKKKRKKRFFSFAVLRRGCEQGGGECLVGKGSSQDRRAVKKKRKKRFSPSLSPSCAVAVSKEEGSVWWGRGVPRTGEAMHGGEGWGMRECDSGVALGLLIFNFLVLERATNGVCDLSGDYTTLVKRKENAPPHPSHSKKFTNTLLPAQGPGATVARHALNRLAACLVVRLLTCAAAPPSLFHGAVPAKGHSTTRGHSAVALRVIHKTLGLFCSSTDIVYKCAHRCVPRMRCDCCAGNSVAYDAFIYRMTFYSAPKPHCQRQTI